MLMIGVWLVVVLFFWANKVSSDQLKTERILPSPQVNCGAHCLLNSFIAPKV